ncbi:bifunctional metallophosphatase/5'-nucleotidase [Allohahella marinimesophila]|uniref:5'-Nucleotidase C-terminal domain-containing protein n=1 Tax=Allohahella marinimesophila TaxID=1054972 RepID=A0ABP7PNA3_9GAMM
MNYLNFRTFGMSALLVVALSACSDDDDDDKRPAPDTEETAGFTLQLLHMADIDGSNADALANVSSFAAIVAGLRAEYPEKTLFVSSGDNIIPGSRYTASSDESFAGVPGVAEPGNGRADIAFLNAMGVQASAVGNHDMDAGPGEFATLLLADGNYPGTQFPYLSSNLDFSTDSNTAPLVVADGQAADTIPNALAKSAVITVDGEQIGLVGATTPTQEVITSTGDVTVLPASDAIPELAAIIQSSVDALTAAGIDKIILLSHMQQIAVEKQLATLLRDVDIIIAGGSNTLLADDTDRLRAGDVAADDYPLFFNSAAAQPVALVNVDADYKYLGRLVVGFDANGVVIEESINAAESGAYVADAETVTAVNGTANATVDAVVTAVNDVLLAKEGNILGNSSVYLNGQRGSVRTEETNLGNLTADANLFYARLQDPAVDISFKNGGGIRSDIGTFFYPAGSTNPDDLTYVSTQAFPAAGKAAGDISQFDIESALAFNNGLTLIDVTAQELKDILETAVSEVENVGGAFPQIGGMSFTYDPSAIAQVVDATTSAVTVPGERVRSLMVGNTAVVTDGVLDTGKGPFRMVALNFLVNGGFGVTTANPARVDLVLDAEVLTSIDMSANDPGAADFAASGTEQDALAEYLKATYPDANSPFSMADSIADPAVVDTRIQTVQ